MVRLDRSASLACGLLLLACAEGALAQPAPPPPEVWVVEEGARAVDVVDGDTGAIRATVDLSDPDADGQLNTPHDACFSTEPGFAGARVFVTADSLVATLDVAVPGLSGPPLDVGAAIGQPGLVLAGCAASPPRRFRDATGGLRLLSLLDVSASLPDGSAAWIVLDQAALITAGGSGAVIGWGLLDADAQAGRVAAGQLPSGGHRHESLYSVRRAGPVEDRLLTYRLSAREDLSAGFTVESVGDRSLAARTAPDRPAPAGAPGRRLQVSSDGSLGTLSNLETGGRCTLGGNLAASVVAGPGPNSYSVFSLDVDSGELLLVDPTACTADRFATGAGAVDLVVTPEVEWRRVFVANRDDDSLTRLDSAGGVSLLPLAPGGPSCTKCPVSVAVSPTQACQAQAVFPALLDADDDGSEDDVRLTWDAPGCATGSPYAVYCQCTDADPGCPCACDCAMPAPGCVCPGLLFFASLGPGLDEPLITSPWDEPVLENPWKKLGTSLDTQFDHIDAGGVGKGWVYGVYLDEAPPP